MLFHHCDCGRLSLVNLKLNELNKCESLISLIKYYVDFTINEFPISPMD